MVSSKLFTTLGVLSTVSGGLLLLLFIGTQDPQVPQGFVAQKSAGVSPESTSTPTPHGNVAGATAETYKQVSASSISEINDDFQFTFTIPSLWEVQAANEGNGLVIYDPIAQGSTAAEKSQLYIAHYADPALPESSYENISNVESIDRNNRQDMRASVEQVSSSISDDMPSWLSEAHLVTVVQDGKGGIYMVAKRQNFDARVYERILDSVSIGQ